MEMLDSSAHTPAPAALGKTKCYAGLYIYIDSVCAHTHVEWTRHIPFAILSIFVPADFIFFLFHFFRYSWLVYYMDYTQYTLCGHCWFYGHLVDLPGIGIGPYPQRAICPFWSSLSGTLLHLHWLDYRSARKSPEIEYLSFSICHDLVLFQLIGSFDFDWFTFFLYLHTEISSNENQDSWRLLLLHLWSTGGATWPCRFMCVHGLSHDRCHQVSKMTDGWGTESILSCVIDLLLFKTRSRSYSEGLHTCVESFSAIHTAHFSPATIMATLNTQ